MGLFNFELAVKLHSLEGFSLAQLRGAATAVANLTFNAAKLDISHKIISMDPIFKRGYVGGLPDWKVNFKSTWIAKRFAAMLQVGDDQELRQLISLYRKSPLSNGMAGYLFEGFAHQKLANTVRATPWPLKVMDTVYDGADLDQPIARITTALAPSEVILPRVKQEIQSFDDLPSNPQNGIYNCPISMNFPLFDAFIVEIKNSFAILWIFQITSDSHHGSHKGYRKVRDIIQRLKNQMIARSPTSLPSVEVRYVLVVPEDHDKGLRWTFPKGWNDSCTRHDHRGKVYCLEVPLSVRFTMKSGAVTYLIE